jgi:hypothetical protein
MLVEMGLRIGVAVMLMLGTSVATIECHPEHLRRQYGSQTSEARGQAGHSEACRDTYNGEARRERDFKEVVGQRDTTQ